MNGVSSPADEYEGGAADGFQPPLESSGSEQSKLGLDTGIRFWRGWDWALFTLQSTYANMNTNACQHKQVTHLSGERGWKKYHQKWIYYIQRTWRKCRSHMNFCNIAVTMFLHSICSLKALVLIHCTRIEKKWQWTWIKICIYVFQRRTSNRFGMIWMNDAFI